MHTKEHYLLLNQFHLIGLIIVRYLWITLDLFQNSTALDLVQNRTTLDPVQNSTVHFVI